MTDTAPTVPAMEARFAEMAAELHADTAARLIELRDQFGLVTPAAIPATGLIPDVVDGQLIESAWGNAIRDRTVERFDTKAQLDSSWPSAPNGSVAMLLDSGVLFKRKGGVWIPDLQAGTTLVQFTGTALAPLTHVTYPYPVPTSHAGLFVATAQAVAVDAPTVVSWMNGTLTGVDILCRVSTGAAFGGVINVTWMLWST